MQTPPGITAVFVLFYFSFIQIPSDFLPFPGDYKNEVCYHFTLVALEGICNHF